MSSKADLRLLLLDKRKKLTEKRRQEAQDKATKFLLSHFVGLPLILSFASKSEEIDLWPTNQFLAQEKRLLLNVTKKQALLPYLVSDLDQDLVLNQTWYVLEPHLKRCKPIALEKISCVFVPGLGFDDRGHRLGYGYGYYDRLLSALNCPAFGIAFQEQHVKAPLPVEKHDRAVKKVYYF